MIEFPIDSTAKVYRDIEGNEVTLRQLIKLEPEWAYGRIKAGEKAIQQNTALMGEIEMLRKCLVFSYDLVAESLRDHKQYDYVIRAKSCISQATKALNNQKES